MTLAPSRSVCLLCVPPRTTKEISYDRLRFRWSRDFKTDSLVTSLDDNLERQERAALALQIDEIDDARQHLRGRLKMIGIAERQRRRVNCSCPKSVQKSSPALAHFSFVERAGYRRSHRHSVAGWPNNFKLNRFWKEGSIMVTPPSHAIILIRLNVFTSRPIQ